MGVIVVGGTTGSAQEVDTTPLAARGILYDSLGNVISRANKTALPATPSGFPMLGVQRGTIARIPRLGVTGSIGILDDEYLLFDPIEGAALNTNIWTASLSTFTNAQATHAITLNSGASVTSGAFSILTSNRQFLKVPGSPLVFRKRVRVNHVNNGVSEFGFGAPSGVTTVVSDGCFFRKTTAGQLQAVVSFNGTEVTQNLGAINTTDFYFFEITVDDDYAHFVVIDSTGTIVSDVIQNLGVGSAFIWSTTHLPAFFRLYNNTAPATAPTLVIGAVMVQNRDRASNKGWAEQLSMLTKNAIVNPVTTFAQLANYANSAAPASATLSNTAAGYTTLGGKWQFAAIAGAVTDYALFGFTNPTPYQLVITQIIIQAINTGAAVATTATILEWGLGVNSNAVSLATAGTYPPMRVALGMLSFIVADGIGAAARGGPLVYAPKTPPVIEPGRFLHIILSIPVGTATAAQVIRGTCLIEGYFE